MQASLEFIILLSGQYRLKVPNQFPLVVGLLWSATAIAQVRSQLPMLKHKARKLIKIFIFIISLCFCLNTSFASEQRNQQMPPVAPSRSLQSGTQNAVVETGIEKSGGPLNIIFLLDCSFSMKEKMKDQVQKIEAAKQVLQNALARIPADINIGLRVFGQGASNIPGGECLETALLVPLGQGNRRSIIEQVR